MPKNTTSTLIYNLVDPGSNQIKERIHQVADLNTNLLVYGETGVGKDFWIQYLLEISRFEKLVNLNCGDVPENLLESEWFGYKKGAFTGADRDREGRWITAEGGILFLNQIDLLSLNMQSKLLRIIERKQFFPLGSNRETTINTRFIFSTDHDIQQKVRDGLFRQDLFYRISSYNLRIPPLRERRGDIMPLIKYFAGQQSMEIELSPRASQTLKDYPWYGNIREIENFITNISIMKRTIEDQDVDGLIKNAHDFLEITKVRELSLAEMERDYIHYLLKKYRNKKKVASLLGISRKSLYNKLDRYKELDGQA